MPDRRAARARVVRAEPSHSGNDTVFDFTHGDDVIDIAAYGVGATSQLEIEIVDGNTVVHLGAQDSVTLVGVSRLSESDFLLA